MLAVFHQMPRTSTSHLFSYTRLSKFTSPSEANKSGYESTSHRGSSPFVVSKRFGRKSSVSKLGRLLPSHRMRKFSASATW